MNDLLEGLLAGAADGCMVVVGAFLALILLGALVSLLFEPAFWLLAATAGIVAAALWGAEEAGPNRPLIPGRKARMTMPMSEDQERQMKVWSKVAIDKLGPDHFVEMLKEILENHIRDNQESDQIDEARDWLRELQERG
jgi:hypothetical protein